MRFARFFDSGGGESAVIKFGKNFKATTLRRLAPPSSPASGHHRSNNVKSGIITGFQLLLAFSDDGSSRDVFETVMPGWSANERKILFCALAGHHGRPPEEAARRSLGPHDACDTCVAAAQAHIQAMFELLRPVALPHRPASALTVLGVGLAGLFVLADWIGSAETWFPYAPPMEGDETFERYWHHAQHAAVRAVGEAGVLPAEVEHFRGISQLFDIPTPSPVQIFAETAPLPDGPSLIVIEDVK